MTSDMLPITTFLLRHQAEIETSHYLGDLLIIEFNPDLDPARVLTFMCDLITNCNPIGAIMTRSGSGGLMIRLAFDVHE